MVAVVLRLLYLSQPMRYDESATFTNTAAHGLRYTASSYTAPNNHVLHTALVRVSVGAFGNHPWAIRFPAFVAGVLLVPATYLAGRRLYGPHAALFAAAAVAALGELIVFSTNARGYTMITLAFLVLIVIGSELRRRHSTSLWLSFAVVAALGLFTVPTMLYPIGAVALWIAAAAIAGDTRTGTTVVLWHLVIALVLAAAFTILLYTPIFVNWGLRAVVANRYVSADSAEGFLLGLRLLPSWLWNDWMLGVPGPARVLLALGAVVGAVFHHQVAADRLPLWLAAAVWSAVLLLLTRRVPGIRIWLFLLPVAAMVAGAGLAWLLSLIPFRRPDLAAAALSVGLAFGIGLHAVRTNAVFDPTLGDISTFRDAPDVAAYLEGILRPGDTVLTDIPADAPLEYYFGRRGVPVSYLAWDSRRSTVHPPLEGSTQLIAVVNPTVRQTLEGVLRVNGLGEWMVREAAEPRGFPHGAVLYFLHWRDQLAADGPLRRSTSQR